MKNIIIVILTALLVIAVWWNFTADYTMTQKQANLLTAPAIVYMKSGVQEDDLYIAPVDIGRVYLKRLPNN